VDVETGKGGDALDRRPAAGCRPSTCHASARRYLRGQAGRIFFRTANSDLVLRPHRITARLIASLPLVSILAMIWLWQDTADTERVAAQSEATFWFILPSLPMFLVLPAVRWYGL
jgi:hypothetical protein